MDTMTTLQCWVNGDDVEDIFTVDIPETKTVSYLKEVIKEKAPEFKDVAAKNLSLYATRSPDDAELEAKLKRWNEKKPKKLGGRVKLSTLSPDGNGKEWLIIVDGPSTCSPAGSRATAPPIVVPQITLNCWVRGQEFINVFLVEISSTARVGTLQKIIKTEKQASFRDIDADSLALYKASLPYDNRIAETIEGLILRQEDHLQPLETVSEYFPEAPPPKHIHIVVEAPASLRYRAHPPSSIPSLSLHNVEARRLLFLRNRKSEAPSSAAKHIEYAKGQATPSTTIYCNRPSDACEIIPPTLLHRALGEFLDNCETHKTTTGDNSLAQELHVAMSNVYVKESDRAEALRKILSEGKLHFNVTEVGHSYTTDGDMSVGPHRYAIVEVKNEVCSTGAEPYFQAGLYYLESTRDHAAKFGGSSLPCIFILLFGPYISFAGATWNTRPVIEPLSVALPMHYHHSSASMQNHAARHLGAFKTAVATLKQYYEDLTSRGPPPSPRRPNLFPYPTDFTSLHNNEKQQFEYVRQDSHKLLFSGTLDKTTAVYIKFVHHYSKDAHLACVSLGCAPVLHGFEVIPGGWFMVVMEDLGTEYMRFCDYTDVYDHPPPAALADNIGRGLEQLHERRYVHGDVRETNIMVSKVDKTKFMLVDFDWAGVIGEVRYPMNVNRTKNLWRPDGAEDGKLILPGHDMAMLDDIRTRYRVG